MEERIWHQHYDPGVKPSLDYPPYPVASFLSKTAETYPDKTALIFGGLAPILGEQHAIMTFARLNRLVDRFAAGLQKLGLQKGDRVAIYMPNCPQFVIAYYGVLRAGGIVAPCNPLYVAREIEHQLNDSGARFAVVLSMLYKNIKEIRDKTALEHVIVTNIKTYFPGLLSLLFTLSKERQDGHRVDISGDANTVWFQDFLKSAPGSPQPVTVVPDDTAVLMYTGGTTGVPKGAQLTHRNVVANAFQSTNWLIGSGCSKEDGQEVMVTTLPLIHCYSMTVSMNLSIFNGYTQIIIPDPRNIKHTLNIINTHKPTILPGVPNLYNALNNHPGVKAGKYDLHSINLCLSGAAPLPVEVQEKFQEITGGRLVEGYGLSETSPVSMANPLGRGGRTGHIGVPISDTEAKIVDLETGSKTLGPGQPGELCIHGPQVMKGYWNMPTETANALRTDADGKVWFHTGDVAEMSEDGYFRIVDRQKEVILAAGGLNVYPRDIEERLYEHPKVLEAAAIGVPLNSSDQRAKIFVVLKDGETLSEDELIDWCRDGLAKYKVPKYVEFRDELPKSMVGKILRRQLMEEEEKPAEKEKAAND
ncbi:MAG: long-chain fatty acid--CoA ligase [Anaerolineae bacterium]|nr:long-chain fatty acid--CoA ligase [Anaerolineae bacterium]MCB9104525.1 long-chain fatty acid--CoA ligase [Anaerolineales bacterium]